MENSALDGKISRPIPLTSFNENVIFPQRLRTKIPGYFISYIGNSRSFFRRKNTANN